MSQFIVYLGLIAVRHYFNVIALFAGTFIPIAYSAKVLISYRQICPPWTKIVLIILVVAALAWGILDYLSLYYHVAQQYHRQIVDARRLSALTGVFSMFTIQMTIHRLLSKQSLNERAGGEPERSE
jgi:hypothetical protein